MVRYFKKHRYALTMYRRYMQSEMQNPADTRFRTHYLCMEGLLKNYHALRCTVIEQDQLARVH